MATKKAGTTYPYEDSYKKNMKHILELGRVQASGIVPDMVPYFFDAAYIMTLWNDYLPIVSSQLRFSYVVRIGMFLKEKTEGKGKEEMSDLFTMLSEEKMILENRSRVNVREESPVWRDLESFLHSVDVSGSIDVKKAKETDLIEVSQQKLETELTRKYSKARFYKLFINAVPKEFWFDPEDEFISRYHWALTRQWPDVRDVMISCEVPRDKFQEHSQRQDIADVYTDVMHQIVMRSLKGEIRGMTDPHSKHRSSSRQFVLKFMLDAEAMAKAYTHIAKIETDKLPLIERRQMFQKALLEKDVTDPNTK